MRKKIFYILFICLFFFIFSSNAKADKGDLIYEVEQVTIYDKKINIKGYAFIHRTHNYVTVYERDENGNENKNKIVKESGGQKVKIIISGSGKSISREVNCINNNYNFYYQMFNHTGRDGDGIYDLNVYNNVGLNTCSDDYSQCYYEDIGFDIDIPIDVIMNNFSSEEELSFKIAAYNNHYGKWTSSKEMKITKLVNNSDYIEVVQGNPRGDVTFTAVGARFQHPYKVEKYTTKNNMSGYDAIPGNTYNIYNLYEGGYSNGFMRGYNICYKGKCFINNKTYSPGKYAVCVNLGNGKDACSSKNANGYCNSCDSGTLVAVYGSWIELKGTSQLVIKINVKGCPVDLPDDSPLSCNENKTLESTCKELTVITDVGSAKVKIEQKGIISSILTPDKLYAGGGFNFGVMYYNTIKWAYVGSRATGELHKKVQEKMNIKIKDYDTYIAGLNISELKIGGKAYDINFLEKKCTTSNSVSKDYYDNELTVSCVFSLPKHVLYNNGDVDYIINTGNFDINNKYYTPMDYSGRYKLEAIIIGMNRITDKSAREDSDDNFVPWTGIWEERFIDCGVDLYSLLINSNGKYKFIYRPIDLANPFPNRNAGINWYDWISIDSNKQRLANTYDSTNKIQYNSTLDNVSIAKIKDYNKNNNYLDWDKISPDGKSSFITDNDYISRGSGS